MKTALILLHEEALRTNHPVFLTAPPQTKSLFIWDDRYFREVNYSLKRLVFIYETLCEMPIEILQGETFTVIKDLGPEVLYVPKSNNPIICERIRSLEPLTQIELVDDERFVTLKNQNDFKRFFQYWKRAEKTAFLKNGTPS